MFLFLRLENNMIGCLYTDGRNLVELKKFLIQERKWENCRAMPLS